MQHFNQAALLMGAQPVPGSFGPMPGAAPTADPSNLSHLDLSSHLGPVQGKGHVYVQFFHSRVMIQNEGELDRWDTRLCIARQVAGDRATCAVSFITEAYAAQHFPAEWAQFKATGLVATQGTPLHELPGITQSQVGLLVLYHVRSIEDLVSIGRDRAQALGLEIAAAFDLAAMWQRRAAEAEPMIRAAEEKAVREAELAKFATENANLQEQLRQTNARMDAMLAMMGQGQAPQGVTLPAGFPQAATSATPIAVEGERVVKREGVVDPFDQGTTGTVSGNDDLGADSSPAELPPDPIAPASRARRG